MRQAYPRRARSSDRLRRQLVGAVVRRALAFLRFAFGPPPPPPAREPDQQPEADARDRGGDRPDHRIALLHGDDPGGDEDDAERGAQEAGRRPRGEMRADDPVSYTHLTLP